MKKTILLCAAAFAMASCNSEKEAAIVENVVAFTEVGDTAMRVNAIEITVSNPKSLKGLTAEDFDLINNAPDGYVNPETGGAIEVFAEDGIVVMKILDAIYESARTGHEVVID